MNKEWNILNVMGISTRTAGTGGGIEKRGREGGENRFSKSDILRAAPRKSFKSSQGVFLRAKKDSANWILIYCNFSFKFFVYSQEEVVQIRPFFAF